MLHYYPPPSSSYPPPPTSFQHWELGPADIGFSVNVTPVPLEEALVERRLKLTLDSQVWNGQGHTLSQAHN